jgi:hypothetical protein
VAIFGSFCGHFACTAWFLDEMCCRVHSCSRQNDLGLHIEGTEHGRKMIGD